MPTCPIPSRLRLTGFGHTPAARARLDGESWGWEGWEGAILERGAVRRRCGSDESWGRRVRKSRMRAGFGVKIIEGSKADCTLR